MNLHDSVVRICKHAFEDCHALEDIVLPANLTVVGKKVGLRALLAVCEAFRRCRSLVKAAVLALFWILVISMMIYMMIRAL